MREFTVTQNDAKQRCDRYLSKVLRVPASAIQRAFRKKDVKQNGKPCRPDTRLEPGDVIRAYGLAANSGTAQPAQAKDYETLQSRHIVYEAPELLILHKPPKIPSQPDFEEMARNYLKANGQCALFTKSFTPSLCHRLDRNTEGLLVFAKTAQMSRKVFDAIKKREVRKIYHAEVYGSVVPSEGEWRNYLLKSPNESRVFISSKQNSAAKEAILRYKVLKSSNNLSLLEIELITGRTHQIRVQCASRGFPVVGDGKYGKAKRGETLALRASKIEIFNQKFQIKGEDN